MDKYFIVKTGFEKYTIYEVCEDCDYSHHVVAICKSDYDAKKIVDALEGSHG